jgi:hypothetical protein
MVPRQHRQALRKVVQKVRFPLPVMTSVMADIEYGIQPKEAYAYEVCFLRKHFRCSLSFH